METDPVISLTSRIASMISDVIYAAGMVVLGLAAILDWISDPIVTKRMVALGLLIGLFVGVCRIVSGIENYRFLKIRRRNEEAKEWLLSEQYGDSLKHFSGQNESSTGTGGQSDRS